MEFEQWDLVENDHWLAKGKKENLLKKRVSFTAGHQLRKLVVFLGSGKNKWNLNRLSID